MDEAAVTHSKILLGKAETIFHELDDENSLVLSCLEYIRRLARMCGVKGKPITRPLLFSHEITNRVLTTEQELHQMEVRVVMMLSRPQVPRSSTTTTPSILHSARQKPSLSM